MTDRPIITRNHKGELHSVDDEPAYVGSNGNMFWFRNGVLHRVGLPAIILNCSDNGTCNYSWVEYGGMKRPELQKI